MSAELPEIGPELHEFTAQQHAASMEGLDDETQSGARLSSNKCCGQWEPTGFDVEIDAFNAEVLADACDAAREDSE